MRKGEIRKDNKTKRKYFVSLNASRLSNRVEDWIKAIVALRMSIKAVKKFILNINY